MCKVSKKIPHTKTKLATRPKFLKTSNKSAKLPTLTPLPTKQQRKSQYILLILSSLGKKVWRSTQISSYVNISLKVLILT
ncbi:MAG: hypothetical protein ACI391_05645, partial [Muribaculaceae bacterium]